MADLSIADVNFHVRYLSGLMASKPGADYHPYMRQPADSRFAIDVRIELDIAPFADPRAGLPVFQTDNSWILTDTGEEYLFSLRSPGKHGQVGWDAYCSRDFRSARVRIPAETLPRWQQGGSGIPALQYPLDEIILFHLLTQNNGALIHCTGAEINSKAWLFAGVSGAGKSTLGQLILKQQHLQLINDDRMVIRQQDNSWRAYGTPWTGDSGVTHNLDLPLQALCFLTQGTTSELREIDKQAAMARLLQVASIPWYLPDFAAAALEFCYRLLDEVEIYELVFRPDDSVTQLLSGEHNG